LPLVSIIFHRKAVTCKRAELGKSGFTVSQQTPVIPGRIEDASPESMEPQECWASWIPGLVSSGAHSRDPLGPSRNDENYERDRSFPRRNSARVLQNITPQKQRAQGKPGALAGTRSLACKMEEAHERSHHRSTGIPGLPCAMVLTVSFVLAPETGLVVSVAGHNA
jgi:hypothetical protein